MEKMGFLENLKLLAGEFAMKCVVIFFFFGFAIGCDVVDPTSLTGPIENISPEALINATVSVLHEEGYTIATADHVAGVVTTAWRDESSFASQAFLDISRRTRISVVIDFSTYEISVQMTKQKKDSDDPWRNDDLSNSDRDRLQSILSRIQARAKNVAQREGGRAKRSLG